MERDICDDELGFSKFCECILYVLVYSIQFSNIKILYNDIKFDK